MLRMTDLDLAGKRVLIREDLNVPVAGGEVTSDARIRAALPTIRAALDAGAAVLLLSHLGRPTEGRRDEQLSLAPVARRLAELLGVDVPLLGDWRAAGAEVAAGSVALLENVRFERGEKACAEDLSRDLARLCEVFVMDAFGTAHRAQASTVGVARYAATACAGPLLVAELEALSRALERPARPLVAIVGGSKVSTKLTVLEALAGVVDQLLVGGGIANTFIAAAGYAVGRSLHEADLLDVARQLAAGGAGHAAVPLPSDVVVAGECTAAARATVRAVDAVGDDEMILDLGPQTAAEFAGIIREAGTVVWNGPVGVFEFDQFGAGTRAIAAAVADSDAYSVAGGGDTLAAIDRYGVADGLSCISTGGGAFLEFIEGKTLPAVAVLEERAGG